mgnify:CR=1 FL=1
MKYPHIFIISSKTWKKLFYNKLRKKHFDYSFGVDFMGHLRFLGMEVLCDVHTNDDVAFYVCFGNVIKFKVDNSSFCTIKDALKNQITKQHKKQILIRKK